MKYILYVEAPSGTTHGLYQSSAGRAARHRSCFEDRQSPSWHSLIQPSSDLEQPDKAESKQRKAWQHSSTKQENRLLQLSLQMAQTGSAHCCYRLSHRHCNPSTCWTEGEISTKQEKQQQFHWLTEPWVHIPRVGAAQLRAGIPGTAAATLQPPALTAYYSKAHEIPATNSNIPIGDKLNAYSQQALEELLHCILTGSPRPGLGMQQVPEKVIPGLILMAQFSN